MPDSPRTIVGQFSSVGGQAQGRAANVRAVEPAAEPPELERARLYMLVEVSGGGGGYSALYRQILNAAQTAFYESDANSTTALLRAVRSAHAVLARANETLEASWRAGITAAALDGWEIKIAQSGPALCLVSHPRTVEQFPGDISACTDPWGGPDRPEIKTFETRVEPGSMLLLAQSGWLERVSPEQLAVASTADNVGVAIDYLGHLARDADLSALVVFVGEPGMAPPAPPSTEAVAPPETPPPPSEETSTATKAVFAGLGARLFRRRARPPAAPLEVEAVSPPPPLEAPPTPETGLAEEEIEPVAEMAAEGQRHRNPWPLVLSLIIIPLLIGGLVLAMWWLRAREVEAQFQQTLDGASVALTDATALTDESAARLRLNAAREFLDAAGVSRPSDPRLEAVESRYQKQLERINHVTAIYGIVPLWDFKGDGRSLSRVLVSGDSLYVLDRGLHEVDRFILSQLKDSVTPMEDEKPVLSKGQQVGDAVISDLLDMTWAAATANQRSKLLTLDTARNLFSYDVTWGPAKVPLGTPEKLLSPQLIQGYNGNLYVADTQANQVWRYRPGQVGYENAPESYFPADKPVDLTGLQALAIDGNVWLLFADGRLLKFLGGASQPFELKNLPDPMRGPVSIAVSQEGDELFIADAGNARILEFNKTGDFQRQLWAREGDALKDMRSIFLDETSSALFILTGDKLWKAPIPERAAAPTPTPTQ